MSEKRKHPKIKSNLHPRSRHRERYNLAQLSATHAALKPFVFENKYGDESIDFFNPLAVRHLNTALLKHYYDIEFWEIPKNYLCPPIPGRADYLHYIADLLAKRNNRTIPRGESFSCLDIGVGANCVYPIIGRKEYGWSFIGSEIDQKAMDTSIIIIQSNPLLKGKVEIRKQANKQAILDNIIQEREYIDLTICNPPFHTSAEEAKAVAIRKISNLKNKKIKQPILNFGGQSGELWCEGGEAVFIKKMIEESRSYAKNCFWFSTLVSKKSHLKNIQEQLKKAKATVVKTIQMGQGNKSSQIIAWTFLHKKQEEAWIKRRWTKSASDFDRN